MPKTLFAVSQRSAIDGFDVSRDGRFLIRRRWAQPRQWFR
jgi:hypothetical protein